MLVSTHAHKELDFGAVFGYLQASEPRMPVREPWMGRSERWMALFQAARRPKS